MNRHETQEENIKQRQIFKESCPDTLFLKKLNENVGSVLSEKFSLKTIIAVRSILKKGGFRESRKEINIGIRFDIDRINQCDEYVYWLCESIPDENVTKRVGVNCYWLLYRLLSELYESSFPARILLINSGESWYDVNNRFNFLVQCKYIASQRFLEDQDTFSSSEIIWPESAVSVKDIKLLYSTWTNLDNP